MLLLFQFRVASEDVCCSIRNVRFKKDIIFSSNAVFHMFVSAVCLLFLTRGVICFYEREARARVPAQACYCRSLCHSDVADCRSCLCMFQSGLQHHAESRDHPMYSLSRSLWGWHPKMKIHHQNGRALPHQAETQGLIKQRKNKLCCENNSFTTKVLKP